MEEFAGVMAMDEEEEVEDVLTTLLKAKLRPARLLSKSKSIDFKSCARLLFSLLLKPNFGPPGVTIFAHDEPVFADANANARGADGFFMASTGFAVGVAEVVFAFGLTKFAQDIFNDRYTI